MELVHLNKQTTSNRYTSWLGLLIVFHEHWTTWVAEVWKVVKRGYIFWRIIDFSDDLKFGLSSETCWRFRSCFVVGNSVEIWRRLLGGYFLGKTKYLNNQIFTKLGKYNYIALYTLILSATLKFRLILTLDYFSFANTKTS